MIKIIRIGFILFVLIISYFIFLIRQDIIDNLDFHREQQRLNESITREIKLARDLNERLIKLNDKRNIEALARTRLGLIKNGEKAYKVINGD